MGKRIAAIEMASELVLWPIEKLTPYERNARTHSDAQIEKIASSMIEFGFTNPILVDGEAGIIAGHGRLLAAKKLALAQVPVIELTHLSEAQKRAYILADNRLAEDAGWDEEQLAEELAALEAMEFDLSLTGFTDEELKDLLPENDIGVGEGMGDGEGAGEEDQKYRIVIECEDDGQVSKVSAKLKRAGLEFTVVMP